MRNIDMTMYAPIILPALHHVHQLAHLLHRDGMVIKRVSRRSKLIKELVYQPNTLSGQRGRFCPLILATQVYDTYALTMVPRLQHSPRSWYIPFRKQRMLFASGT